jgi:hypothetical protein
MPQYYILNQDLRAQEVFNFIRQHQLQLEVHLNRTRFWIPKDSSVLTEFLLRFADSCPSVDPNLDPITGL